ncbi:MAG: NADase-type glycan-binding domain-containing protein, partial [Spirochaetota bacterium]
MRAPVAILIPALVAACFLFPLAGCSRSPRAEPEEASLQEASPKEQETASQQEPPPQQEPSPKQEPPPKRESLPGRPGSPDAAWEEFSLRLSTSVWASSELKETRGDREVVYAAGYLFDGDHATCWAEGAEGDGTGESVTFIADRPVERIGLVNGYARDEGIFMKNNRVKAVRISLIPAFTAPGLVTENDFYLYFGLVHPVGGDVVIEDTRDLQYVDVPFTGQQQLDLMREAAERFLAEHPPFASAIEQELGLGAYEELSGGGREEYWNLMRAAFS